MEATHLNQSFARADNKLQFIDLDDDIGVDDWLVPRREISRRRLVRQTPRYNIYKADWFGDVLLYEPIGETERRRRSRQILQRHGPNLASSEQQQNKTNQEHELRLRLGQLNLHSNANHTTPDSSDNEHMDSAYSSISSTPQYHTKSHFRSEFEFPSERQLSPLSSSLASTLSTDSLFDFPPLDSAGDTKSSPTSASAGHQPANRRPSLVLNKHSYVFTDCLRPESKQSGGQNIDPDSQQSRGSWSELNELRLVAHEGFMLFMGASMDAPSSGEDSTALVIQMNHPRATSLYNLLHANKFTPAPTSAAGSGSSSPVDRFFNPRHQHQLRQPALTIEAKLNICQQVTNAMTYLHGKNIVHSRLTSVNIYIEFNQRVKISLLDDDETPIAAPGHDGPPGATSASFNLPALTYLSPELIKTIQLTNKQTETKGSHVGVQMDTNQLSKETDIYSFGTLLFELFEEKFPFACSQETQMVATSISASKLLFNSPKLTSPTGPLIDSAHNTESISKWSGNIKLSASELIFQIGSGQVQNKNNLSPKCPPLIASYISACWTSNPKLRPTFKQLAFE